MLSCELSSAEVASAVILLAAGNTSGKKRAASALQGLNSVAPGAAMPGQHISQL